MSWLLEARGNLLWADCWAASRGPHEELHWGSYVLGGESGAGMNLTREARCASCSRVHEPRGPGGGLQGPTGDGLLAGALGTEVAFRVRGALLRGALVTEVLVAAALGARGALVTVVAAVRGGRWALSTVALGGRESAEFLRWGELMMAAREVAGASVGGEIARGFGPC